MVKINRKHMLLIILVAYVIAYLLVAGSENYKVKNEYEKAKIESYYKESLKWIKVDMI